MDDSSTTAGAINHTDEDILTYTVSDEALEAAAGMERGGLQCSGITGLFPPYLPTNCCVL
jgi:hypothetical protein